MFLLFIPKAIKPVEIQPSNGADVGPGIRVLIRGGGEEDLLGL